MHSEIEFRIRKISKDKSIGSEKTSLRELIHELFNKKFLNSMEVDSLEELLYLLDKAIQGAKIDSRTKEWVLNIGPRILHALEDRLGETTVPKLLKLWKKRDGAAGAEIGIELAKSLVLSPKAFMMSMRDEPECFEEWLDSIDHIFTIFESSGEVEDDLYQAYYEKLKDLMISAATPLLSSEFNVQAKETIDTLNQVKVSRIW